MSIFISIASYSDILLERTIRRALETANRPDELRFGVVDQSILLPNSTPIANICSGQIRYVNIHPKDARGCCWARSIAMSLYSDEDWFMQIDSHTDFDQGWDTYFINYANILDLKNNPGVISMYPPGFEMVDNVGVLQPCKDAVLFNIVVGDSEFKNDLPTLPFIGTIKPKNEPLMGFHVAGGCIFSTGSFVNKFPYDPWFYFIGEEQSMSVRLYTHGWNIFHTPSPPVYHLYNTGNCYRPLHWNESHEQMRTVKWPDLERVSVERFKDLVFRNKDLGVYGLGKVRSLNHFADFCGIDYTKKEIRKHYQLAGI